ncbi:MAG: hypothetical protein F6K39_48025 [Okeania sp. SIO3B3]|nr:hypothetical protein [Okeania sp. SIO3B3]
MLFKDIEIIPVPYKHGNITIQGYRINDFAYITDCNFIPETSYPLLENLEVLFLNAVKLGKHPTHFNLEEAINEAKKIKAKKTYLTHISHDIEHEKVSKELPENIYLAYDSLKISLKD